MASLPTLDQKQIDQLRNFATDDDPEFLKITIDMYLRVSQEYLTQLRNDSAQGDAEAINFTAHTLKSSSLTIGAIELGSLAGNLERAGANGDLADISSQLQLLEAEYLRVKSALEAESNIVSLR